MALLFAPAWASSGNAAAFTGLTDPSNNIAIGRYTIVHEVHHSILIPPFRTSLEMHQYLDSDGSGTNATCVDSTVGVDRLTAATAWLTANNFKGLLGEIGAGSNGAYQCHGVYLRAIDGTKYPLE